MPTESNPQAGRRRELIAFLRTEVGSASLLFVALAVAIFWATVNESLYRDLWSTRVGAGALNLQLRDWVGEGLMAGFFLVVGLEVRREATAPRGSERASLGIATAAAIGGMVLPAIIAIGVLFGGSDMRAWAIPIATDIALSLAVLALLGDRITTRSRSFLLTLAIVDDIGAVILIAVAFPSTLKPVWLLGVAACIAGIALISRVRLWPVIPLGIVLWFCMHESGVHASLAGFIVAVLISGRHADRLEWFEERLHPVVALAIIPLFALSHAGVAVTAGLLGSVFTSRVGLAVLLGLMVGKPVGIVLAARLAKTRLHTRSLWTVGMAAGVGCTVALFVTDLALGQSHAGAIAKVAVIIGSTASAAGAFAVGRTLEPSTE